MNKTVSIITPCYNGAKYLRGYFESILAQTYTDIELIFVDDGSTDETQVVAQGFEQQLNSRGINYKYIYQENQGQAVAINTALKLVSGEYLMWMDADDMMRPKKIQREVSFLEDHKDFAFVQCGYEFIDEKNIVISQHHRKVEQDNTVFFLDLIYGTNVTYSGIYLVRTEALKLALGELKIYESRAGQNWQLLLPLAANYKCGCIEEVLFQIKEHADSHSRVVRSVEQSVQRLNGLEDILLHVIGGIDTLPRLQKEKLIKEIGLKYADERLLLFLQNEDYALWIKEMRKRDLLMRRDCYSDRMLISRDNCTGCGACVAKCSCDALKMEEDDEGFLYPIVDSEKCVGCNQCRDICPALNVSNGKKSEDIFYYFRASEEVLRHSSSGGAFGVLAEGILKQGGCVVGCAFAEDYLDVKHVIIRDIKELSVLQKAKYIQSNMESIYKQVQELLADGRKVLYVGTPCQVAGVRSFMGNDNNLYTIDLICHGVPSHYAWKKFLDEEIGGREKLKAADFRVESSDNKPCLRLVADTTSDCSWSSYYEAFIENVSLRRSCSNCPYPYVGNASDLTIGDFWGSEVIVPQLHSDKGNSIVKVNDAKGNEMLELLRDSGICEVVNDNRIYDFNPLLKRCSKEHPGRKVFYKYLNGGMSFSDSLRRAQSEMFDFGVVSWFYAPNYGAALTAYALNRYLTGEGHSALMIDLPKYVLRQDAPCRRLDSPTRDFIQRYCNVSKQYEDEVDILHLNRLCKNYIVGSDQLWNYYEHQFYEDGGYYFLDFAGQGKGKISCATSFGGNVFRDKISNVKQYLQRFDAVSVRETSGVDICKGVGVDAVSVLDPVFLLDREHYSSIASAGKYDIDEPYVFVYMIRPTEEKWREIQKCCQGKQIVYCPDLRRLYEGMKEEIQKNVELVEAPSVETWLYLIQHSESVITDSYHGVCFSIIMDKEYIQLNREDQPERFTSLYSMLECSDGKRLQDVAKQNLNIHIQRTKDWLNNAIGNLYPRAIHVENYESDLQIQWNMIRRMQRKLAENQTMLMKLYLDGRLQGKRVIIRGAGMHTEELLKLINHESIVGIWDSKASADSMYGLPCYCEVDSFSKQRIDAILISSYRYRREMMDDVSKQLPEVEIIEPYTEWEKIGIPVNAEFYVDSIMW